MGTTEGVQENANGSVAIGTPGSVWTRGPSALESDRGLGRKFLECDCGLVPGILDERQPLGIRVDDGCRSC